MSGPNKDDFTMPSSRSGFNPAPSASRVSYLDGNGHIIGELPQGYIVGQQFRVRSTLGEGGMSYVYLCDDLSLNRQVALKVMRVDAQSNEQAFMRFHREGQAVAMLSHDNVVKVHSLNFTESDQPFLVMEVVQGVPLSHLLEVGGPLKLPRALKFLTQICDGISHAHANGVIHRDLKLSNIMLIEPDTHEERIKILDFGIAKVVNESSVKMTQTGEVFGSPAYMSPEQALGKAVDLATDQYSLGCIAFELLTGRTPFSAENYLAVLMAHVQEQAPSVNEFVQVPVPAHIERTIARLLAKEPKDRFKSIDEVRKAFVGEVKVAAPAVVKFKKPTSLRRLGLSAAALLCVGAAASLIFLMRPQPQKTIAADKAITNMSQLNKLNQHDDTLDIANLAMDDGELTGRMVSSRNCTTFNDKLVGKNISDTGLANLHAAKNLRELDLTGCPRITPAGIATLSKLSKLAQLTLNKTATDDHALQAFTELKLLKHLSVENCDAITDAGIAFLPEMSNLEELWMSNLPKVTPEALRSVGKIKTLKVLHIDNNELAPGFKYLTKSKIILLSASGSMPAMEDLAPLTKMRELKSLFLDSDGIDKKTLLELAQLPHLRTLSVKRTAFSRTTIQKFHAIAPKCNLLYDEDKVEEKDFN